MQRLRVIPESSGGPQETQRSRSGSHPGDFVLGTGDLRWSFAGAVLPCSQPANVQPAGKRNPGTYRAGIRMNRRPPDHVSARLPRLHAAEAMLAPRLAHIAG